MKQLEVYQKYVIYPILEQVESLVGKVGYTDAVEYEQLINNYFSSMPTRRYKTPTLQEVGTQIAELVTSGYSPKTLNQMNITELRVRFHALR